MEALNNQKVEWTDIMVDVETTGTSIATAGVIQLSAVSCYVQFRERNYRSRI